MRIAGFQKNSFVDYPKKVAAVVFTPGCNLDCYYCHNRSIINDKKVEDVGTAQEILDFLKKRRGFLEAIVITGGEPTLQKDLMIFIMELKEMGYQVKLDTNGTRPDVIKNFIAHQLIDYWAMDMKAPLNRYEEICGVRIDKPKIEESIQLLIQGTADYEFRTTYVPSLKKEDILDIAATIQGAKLLVLQQYRIPQAHDIVIDHRLGQRPHTAQYIQETAALALQFVQTCQTRGI